MAYYSRIRDLREDNDLSQKELAKHLHVSQRSYSHYENGDRAMPIDILERLAAYYNTSMDYLVERTDVKRPYPPAKDVKN
ncbi:MAG: helix-turn-helix transcriptional regulator [Lachnospiraceae bacterium]|nr:helix-turn-helix transcriptional regulator [Lachnospiraceae bacterium]